jgi:serine/threonine protein kinase
MPLQINQVAGRRYGEGVKGFVEDCACQKGDEATFCKMLRELYKAGEIESLKLYWSVSKHMTVSSGEEIQTVIDIISSRRTIVVKTFKGANAGDGFKDEIRGFLKVSSILKGKKYHTISPGFTKDGKEIYGVVISRVSGAPSYHTFTEGCSTPVDEMKFASQEQFDKFVKDIGEALAAMHAQNYYHNDIKPDNMIYCPAADRFKLIDWELSGKFKSEPPTFYKCGTSLYNHPLKFYLGGLPAVVSKQLMTFTVMRMDKHKWLKEMKSYRHIRRLAGVSLDWIIETEEGAGVNMLHHKYAPFFDNWAFALCIIFLAEKHNMRVPEEELRSLMEPFLPRAVLLSK